MSQFSVDSGPAVGGRSTDGDLTVSDERSFAPRHEGDSVDKESLKALAVQAMRSTGKELRIWMDAKTDKASEAVENRPATAIAAALGVGVIIGFLMRR
jgi:ElaB/YqjD/DUF883 family membrane-anchored ribosome-binding protein